MASVVNLWGAWPVKHVVNRADKERLIEHELLHVIAGRNWPEERCPSTEEFMYLWNDLGEPCAPQAGAP